MGATQSSQSTCTLETPLGNLRGIRLSDSKTGKPVYCRYARIPFALPPIGQLRWRRPQPLPADFRFDSAAGDYSQFGSICPQPVYPLSDALSMPPPRYAAPPVVNVQDEDCLYLNVWVPGGEPPEEGWPVQFFIHGGWLQIGDPMQSHTYDPFDLLSYSTPRVIVAPAYRLNVFGFFACPELASLNEDPATGNYGFWDQRAALEWTSSHIHLFSGNPHNISVGGLSAGAYSAFFQLYYDTYLPESERIIKRSYLWSNAVGIQPNTSASATNTAQLSELLSYFNIPPTASPSEKIAALRAIPFAFLAAAVPKLELHTFRATTDSPFSNGGFIPPSFLPSIHNGSFAARLKANNTSILLGEVSHEGRLYRLINPPSSKDSLIQQLENYYPFPVVAAMLEIYPLPAPSAPAVKWQDLYGRICSDCQVHATSRGLTHCLLHPPNPNDALPVANLHRYHISWRAESLDQLLKPEMGVCHGADMPIWWMSGYRAGWTEADKEKVREFLEPFGRFLKGGNLGSGGGERRVREFGMDGVVRILRDQGELRDFRMSVWEKMWEVQREVRPRI